MAKIHKTFGVLSLLSLLWISACNALNPTPAPTQDLNPFRTEVAATVMAQVTLTEVARPTNTPIPPTPTATFTLAPTATPTASYTSALTITLPGGTPAVATVDLAQWVAQSIPDDTVFKPGEAFTLTWTLRNVGTSTWTAGYMLRFYSGETFGAPNEILLGREVLPGDTVDINISMKAPIVPGGYRTDWVMANERRSNFKEPVFLKITVIAVPTNTPQPTLTPTPTQ